jgi:hypothetical protein
VGGGRVVCVADVFQQTGESDREHGQPADSRAGMKYQIRAQRGSGPELYFTTGGKLANHGAPRLFATKREAASFARALIGANELLEDYRVSVHSVGSRRQLTSSEVPKKLERAASLLKDFSGHDAAEILKIKETDFSDGLVIGPLHGLLYGTVRDGRSENYIHRFRKVSRPLLAASSDGKALRIVGGRFQFTEAGIEDR